MASAERLIEVFNEARARPVGPERDQFLEDACSNDPELREQVLSLLEADVEEGRSDFLKNTAGQTVLITEKPGDKIGRYKLLQQIGEGGCGVVYMAEQEEPVRRRVALKVIKLGMDTKNVIARFEAERQALALMDHPNIARVLDAGATETGRPYFVMELVRGIKITDFCDKNELSTEERLKLFMQVCQAIQHAHQKGIIHRDVKPSNILVTSQDGVPVPKVIDFGIAKATTDQRLTDKTVFTAFEQFIGTPAYMSPEQAEMSALDIDTRTDIYSLGVLLYELLTGSPPFDQKELLAAGLDAMRRTIREQEPPRPSNRLSTMAADALATTALHRHTEPPKLVHLVRGDLDWIAMKCLEKDRARRYETANGLAADIERHIKCEPVIARPPSRLYEFQKTVRRHKFGFAAATALVLVLALGVVISTWQAVRATKAEQLANDRLAEVAAERDAKELALMSAKKAEELADDRLAESEAVSAFMGEVLQSPDPSREGRTIQVVELLDRAAKRLETELAGQPAHKAKLQTRLGITYFSLGLYQEAISLQEKVRDYCITTYGLENTNTISAMHVLASSYSDGGRLDEALKIRTEVLGLSRKVSGPKHPQTLASMHNLAKSYDEAGRLDEALKMREEVLTLHRKVLGPEHPDTLNAMGNLANSYAEVGRRDEALKMREELVTLRRKASGPGHPATLDAMHNLANSYDEAGRRDEALKMREEVLVLSREVMGPEHPATLDSMHNLARSYFEMGRREEALKLQEEVLTLSRKVLGLEHPRTLGAIQSLAISYVEAGRRDEALKLREEVLTLCRKMLGPEHPDTLDAMHNLASSYDEAGRRDEALKLREDVLTLRRKVQGPEHRRTLHAMHNLANSYAAGRSDEALRLREEVLTLRRKVLGPEHPDTLDAMSNLAYSYLKAGRRNEALKLREEIQPLSRKVLGPEHPATLLRLINLAWSYRGAGRVDEAITLGQSSLELFRRVFGLTHGETLNAMTELAISYQVADRIPEAISLEEESLRLKRQHLAPGHKRTIESIENLAKCYDKTNRQSEAAALRQEAKELRAARQKQKPAELETTPK